MPVAGLALIPELKGIAGEEWPDPGRPRFAGHVAVVTGAASGIGQQVAIHLAAEGAAIVAVDIDVTGLSHLAASLEGAASSVVADVSSGEDARAARLRGC
jgi:NAD(P)-dependent dehydrogenase (short-subunit alcohol dehydrogenase family)